MELWPKFSKTESYGSPITVLTTISTALSQKLTIISLLHCRFVDIDRSYEVALSGTWMRHLAPSPACWLVKNQQYQSIRSAALRKERMKTQVEALHICARGLYFIRLWSCLLVIETIVIADILKQEILFASCGICWIKTCLLLAMSRCQRVYCAEGYTATMRESAYHHHKEVNMVETLV